MEKKRLLFITSRPLYPIIGGDQIRTVQQLNFLLEEFDVDIVMISPTNFGLEMNKKIPGVINFFGYKVGRILSLFQTFRFLFNKLPLQVNYYYNSKIANKINKIIHNYDYVFCNNIRTAEYVRSTEGIIKYLDFVDAISMNYEKARHRAIGIKKLMYNIDFKRCRSYEQQCLNSFDSCAVISDIDNNYIKTCQN